VGEWVGEWVGGRREKERGVREGEMGDKER
jgi:hypothetical protein